MVPQVQLGPVGRSVACGFHLYLGALQEKAQPLAAFEQGRQGYSHFMKFYEHWRSEDQGRDSPGTALEPISWVELVLEDPGKLAVW